MARHTNGAAPLSGRVAVYADLENLLHADRVSGDMTALIGTFDDFVAAACSLGSRVSIVADCDRYLAANVVRCAAEHHVILHAGRIGADRADRSILDRLRWELPASVTTVVIASGDGIFAPVAAELAGRGLQVTVIARAGAVAASLAAAAHQVITLTPRSARPVAPTERGLIAA